MVVQLVAFTDAESQMPLYVDAMQQAGFARAGDFEPEAWRVVPNRRWYYRVNPTREQARETLLVHRVEASPSAPSTAESSAASSAPNQMVHQPR